MSVKENKAMYTRAGDGKNVSAQSKENLMVSHVGTNMQSKTVEEDWALSLQTQED